MIIFWGNWIAFKKLLTRYNGLELNQFYNIHNIFFIPLFWSKKIGLFKPNIKKEYYELDNSLEKRLLGLPKNSSSKIYLEEIKKYEKEQHKKKIYYETHKRELDKKENDDFIKFLKSIGIILGIAILLIIIKNILF